MQPDPVQREWLEADGLGGFAMGTTALVRERRYHALLCTATTPPTGRRVLVAGIDANLRTAAGDAPLSAQRYLPDVLHPRGDLAIESFAPSPWPTWTFRLADGTRVRHELFVPRGASAVVLQWTLLDLPAGSPAELTVRPFVSGRDHHQLGGAAAVETPARAGERVRWQLPAAGVDVVACGNGDYSPAPLVYRDFLYGEEQRRGYAASEDLVAPGTFRFDLGRGPARLVLAAGELPAALRSGPAETAIPSLVDAERRRRAAFASPLHLAASAYVAARGSGRTLIAGYPWFTDWGRDTFIAIRGLCLATDDLATAREILSEWAQHVSAGMLPNRFPDAGEAVEYHTVDGALWFVVAAGEFLARADVARADRERLVAAIDAILTGYSRGTRHGIAVDDDGLLRAGEPGRQLTWMDAIVDGRVVTPRIGKPVEVQALWYNALRVGQRFDRRWRDAAERARRSFAERFWNHVGGCLHDVVDADHVRGALDSRLRPNQIFAVGGLPEPLLAGARARAVVDLVERQLLTPLGLRTLGPHEDAYRPVCKGGVAERDLAYHNGTVWPWLLGPFVEAWLRVRGASRASRSEAHRRFVQPLHDHLSEAGVGHVSEIADGDAPHTPRGCPFQAWSLGELLRLELDVLADRDAAPPRVRPAAHATPIPEPLADENP